MMRLFVAAICLALVSGCTMPILQPIEAVEEQPYRLGAGDRVRVATYGEQYLTGEYSVDGTGDIQFPLIGNVAVSGKTTSELRDEIATRLGSEFLRNPRVAVEVAVYRPVYVLGEVAKPGEVPFTERMTVFAVVAKAGGFTYRANRKYVFVRRENEAVEKAFPFAPNLAVRPGDQIRVAEVVF
jgi:protein involved in polysaccharide export with SLBB domain